jgi:hypothetical protein
MDQVRGKVMSLNDLQKRLIEENLTSQWTIPENQNLEVEIACAFLLDIHKENQFYKLKEYLLHPILFFAKNYYGRQSCYCGGSKRLYS